MTAFAADDQNLSLLGSIDAVDRMNAEFYGQHPYPWRPLRLDRTLSPDFSRKMLCQAVGDWTHRAIPESPDIWVAGCGTNQALIASLAFPTARVMGSDLARPSLDLCARTAAELSVTNLELRQESLNACDHRDAFDYILCTGVIHHNADPAAALAGLARALRRDGILELMVYNRFHRVYPPAFQKAVRILAGGEAAPGSAAEFEIARALVDDFPVACGMREFLAPFRKARREHFADVLLQPLEYSYTVRGLAELGRSCGLELVAPAISQFDRPNGTFLWNLRFDSRQLQDRYDALPDVDRWHVANLLLAERSPWLWFYLRRIDSGARRIPERQVCEEFLESRFEPATAAIEIWVLGGDGKYKRLDKPAAHPPPPRDESLRAIVEGARGGTRMRDLIESNRLTCGFPEVNETRLRLTTPLFPSLVAVSD